MNQNTLIKYYTNKDLFEDELINHLKSFKNNKQVLHMINDISRSLYDLSLSYGTCGRLYCIYNKMYDIYGSDVYKLGKTIDIGNRLNSYITCYFDPPELKCLSDIIFDNYSMAECLLFEILKDKRMGPIESSSDVN